MADKDENDQGRILKEKRRIKTHSAGSERREATLSPVLPALLPVLLSADIIVTLSERNPLITCVRRRSALVPVG